MLYVILCVSFKDGEKFLVGVQEELLRMVKGHCQNVIAFIWGYLLSFQTGLSEWCM